MAPKKSAAKGAAGKPKPAGSNKAESKDVRWLRLQLNQLEAQRAGGPPWVEEPHTWHEEQLQMALGRFEDGSLTELSQEVKDQVEFYVSQLADGQDVPEEEFYIDREVYADLVAPPEQVLEPYVRAPSSEEALAVVTQLQSWTETSVQGIDKLRKLLVAHEDSADVQQAGVTKLGGLLAEARDAKSTPPGLAAVTLTPIVIGAMKRFPRDAGVQRCCCSVLRGIVVTDGGVTIVADAGGAALAVQAMKAHLADVEVCKSGAACLYAMIQKTEPASPERLAMRSTNAHQVLAESLSYHPTDRALDRACRVTMPELKD